jgi:hypothetical protein
VLHCLRVRIRLAVTVSTIILSNLPAVAQTVEKGPVRTVLALGRVSSVVDAPMSFKLSRVSIPGGTSAVYRGAHSLVYVVSGVVTIAVANDLRSARPKEGAYLPAATDVTIHASKDAAAELLQFELLRSADASKSAMNAPASVTELHQMKIPADALKPGPYEFSMTTVILPAGASRPRPHTRSGAALYYVLADGTITTWPSANIDTLSGESRSESRRIGDIQEEPYGFIHSWSPKADVPLVLLQANISQEGAPEIIFVK